MKSLIWRDIVSAIAAVLLFAVKFVNSFARRQHLYDISATVIDIDWNILSILLPCPRPTFVQNEII